MKKKSIIALGLAVAFLVGSGCRTFNRTEEDMAKERRDYQKGAEGPKWGTAGLFFIK